MSRLCCCIIPPPATPPPEPLPPPSPPLPIPLLPLPPIQPNIIVRAIFSYEGQNPDDVCFDKGDEMCIISNKDDPWLYVEHLTTKIRGYIPSNFVVFEDGKATSHDAWYDITRRDAEKQLLMMGNPSGTYIIRPCSISTKFYVLSVRYHTADNFWVVKHYKIRPLDNGKGYFISGIVEKPNIKELIKHYEQAEDGLCCQLTNPCPRVYQPPVQFRDIEVNRDSIKAIRKLGSGHFGEVWLAKWNSSLDVAVKMLKTGSMDRDLFIQEAKLMHKLHNRRIVQILGICKEPPDAPVYIITELMEKGALLDFLQSDEGAELMISEMIDMMSQISEGMAYLECINFIHRDLRAANILVANQNYVKVADFGLARFAEDEVYGPNTAEKFPIKWTAPEATSSRRLFSIKSDVWSFGILMYEIVTYGRTPYKGMNNLEVMEKVRTGYRLPNPHDGKKIICSTQLYNIMLNCWDKEPENRSTFENLNKTFDDWLVNIEQQYLDN